MVRIALIAHDAKKDDIVDLAAEYHDFLATAELVATGTTGKRLREATGLDVERKQSGTHGGDLEIGAEVANRELAGIVFLRDPQTAQPHEPDISALLRICDVHDTPLATTATSARYVLDGLQRDHGE